jgi:predicted nucleic-acid-binding protein
LGEQAVKITADSNVLLRAIVGDHPAQAKTAEDILRRAEVVAVTLPTLCEVVWVLAQGYKISVADIAQAIRTLINAANVVVDRLAAEAGLAMLDAGGDFADGAIAADGQRLGGDVFASFDKQAVRLLEQTGVAARLLTP